MQYGFHSVQGRMKGRTGSVVMKYQHPGSAWILYPVVFMQVWQHRYHFQTSSTGFSIPGCCRRLRKPSYVLAQVCHFEDEEQLLINKNDIV